MKTIIAGSRDGVTLEDVRKAVASCPWHITSTVSGTARGVDQFGEIVAKELDLYTYRVPANWNLYGKRAGIVRNELMARGADALIAVWDGKSRGTEHMIGLAKKLGLRVYVYMVQG